MRGLQLLSATIALSLPLPTAATAEAVELPVTSNTITHFTFSSDQRTFGKLEFLGGISYSSSNPLLGAVSAIRFRPDHQDFVAVLDTGHWLTGRIERDAEGRLSGLADLKARSMLNDKGQDENVKYQMDAEGLALGTGEVLVSFENLHRIDAYPDPGFMEERPARRLALPIPLRELRSNRGMETLAMSPEAGPLGAVPVTVTERSLDADGNVFAAVLDGPRAGIFAVTRNDPWDITDGAFLPNGDLLLLERRFRLSDGIGMRIRRIEGQKIRPRAVVDGDVLIDVDLSHQIDNMEGLDVVAMADDDIRIIVVSDDNHSILQRNLMLEFRLLPEK
ncbi:MULTISPECIES: esterase-like activity of phytase family protein [unclassified Shinella]|uniref:esterase-like activity of phytase family protein n=1 Tax=unclassified Shinella TaxID=2643062 RepID=UPI00234EBD30|nr:MULTISPECIES: esterase-like activity of phytase family protein [unclassified Shinella]MCO5152240.1 esterase-like activity of phytase family protein [Shinella sp.]